MAMSTRMLFWGLSATMVLAALLFMAALAIVVGGPLLGEPLRLSWSVGRFGRPCTRRWRRFG